MKRFLLFFLAAALCLSMTACGSDTHSHENDTDEKKTTRTTQIVTTAQNEDDGETRVTTTTATTKRITQTMSNMTIGTTKTTTATTGKVTTTTEKVTTTTRPVEDNKVFHTFLMTADEADGLQIALTHGSVGSLSPVKEGAEAAQTIGQKNYYWNSRVDLSELSTYGVEKVEFNPAALSLSDDKVKDGLLQYPVYGADGRVAELADAVTAVYNGKDFAPSDRYGLRAIGVPMASYFMTYGLAVDLAFRARQEGALVLDEESFFYYETEEYGCAAEFLRLVFFDTETGQVLARAKPDVEHAKTEKTSIAAPLRFIDDEDAFLSNGSVVALTAEETHRISVLLYLDGEKMTNADVVSGAISSVWRGLSLHFSITSE